MAVKFKELRKKLESTPLTEDELILIKNVEDYIDEIIVEKYDQSLYHEVSIDMAYTRFSYSPKTQSIIQGLGQSRIPKMVAELERRYKVAGWEIKYHIDDGLEGNMSGGDYMILKGK